MNEPHAGLMAAAQAVENARVVPYDSGDRSMFDVANWRPVPREQYASRLAECFLTFDEPSEVVAKHELLRDGRWRIVTHARVLVDHDSEGPPEDDVQPYLMILYTPEGEAGKPDTHCFMRTDVELALA